MKWGGALVVGILIALGISTVLPVYLQKRPALKVPIVSQPTAMLSFSVIYDYNIPKWCNALSLLFKKYSIKATLFITGKIANKFPDCVSVFSSNNGNNVDIGSQTYDYVRLTSLSNYNAALEEVKNGKEAVDAAGKLNSTLFKAPYGMTDQSINSLLSRSGILADFSSTHQYNKYEKGQFIKYQIIAYNGSNYFSKQLLDSLSLKKTPLIINFDNSNSIDKLDSFISKLKSEIKNIRFINASELTGMNLTVKKE
jgi:peptidoglycan/xylan/chitin deacetylase (PgdA/CDA1 family)